MYSLVAVGGYLTCGNQCPEDIIINRDPLGDSSDLLMDAAKLMLLICLIVGIIIRNQSNKAAIFGIIDQFKKIQDDAPVLSGENSPTEDKSNKIKRQSSGEYSNPNRLSNSLRRASTEIIQMEIDNTPGWAMAIIQFFNCAIPAIVAILVKDALITYVESGSGFLAPVFIVVYPCLITIRLHQSGVAPVSPTLYIFIWFYLIVVTTASYTALLLSFYFRFFDS